MCNVTIRIYPSLQHSTAGYLEVEDSESRSHARVAGPVDGDASRASRASTIHARGAGRVGRVRMHFGCICAGDDIILDSHM